MDKNEILKRSQEENQDGDEREKQIQTKSESFSRNLILLVLLILTFFNFAKGLPADHFLAIFWAGTAARYYYLFYKSHKKQELFWGLFSTAFCISDILSYLGVFQ